MNDLHPIQMRILRELIFHPNSKFSKLNITGITNDHFSYHINKLIKKKLVEKDGMKYSLSTKGKIFSARMDTSDIKTERQPKVSVLLRPILKKGTKTFYGIQQRLKEPYYGYYGFMAGKIKWGEKVFEAAKRELEEEMGIQGDFVHDYILHEMVYSYEGDLLEDKYFHCISVNILKDDMKSEEEGCKNFWMTKSEFMKITPKYHNEVEIFNWFNNHKFDFIEQTYFINKF